MYLRIGIGLDEESLETLHLAGRVRRTEGSSSFLVSFVKSVGNRKPKERINSVVGGMVGARVVVGRR